MMKMFDKEPTRDAHGRSAWDGSLYGARPVQAEGLVAGTQVATAMGWRNISAVQAGDKVLTFDDGLQAVLRVERTWIFTDRSIPASAWPLHVPAGALGNRDDMVMLPEQAVMVESDLGEEMFGDPFTLVQAQALEGYKGIVRMAPRGATEVIKLHFAGEQVVFANIGALFHCPSSETATIADLLEDTYVPGYEVLSLAQARRFVEAMISEDAQDAAWNRAAEAMRNVTYVA